MFVAATYPRIACTRHPPTAASREKTANTGPVYLSIYPGPKKKHQLGYTTYIVRYRESEKLPPFATLTQARDRGLDSGQS